MLKASELLKEKRRELNLELKDIEASTKIKEEYLYLIEEGKFSNLPSSSHASGFVKNYAGYLGISEKEIMPLFRREFDYNKEYQVLPRSFQGKEEIPLKRLKLSQTLMIFGVIIVLFIAYLLFQYRFAFISPSLTIDTPKDRSVVATQVLEVNGKTQPDTSVYINKEAVNVGDDGRFSKNLSVFPGNFVLNIEAINKFGKKTNKKIIVEIKNSY